MEVGLLGPLELTGPTGALSVSGAKERLVLALVALRIGEVVSRDSLIDALWGDEPPATAVKTLQGHVARARRALEAVGLVDVLATRAPGYVLTGTPAALDVTGFERGAAAGRAALGRGDPGSAAGDLRQALALWRGDALADCRDGGWATSHALRLDELRLVTVEDRIDADLQLGRHGALVGELESLVTQHPLRERLWAGLMVALHGSGRQADALRAYQRARDVLVGELGLEPGEELRRLEAAVLAGAPVGTGPDVPRLVGRLAPVPNRLAVTSSAMFVGRAPELERLRVAGQSAAGGVRQTVLLSGEPGIGKTSLSAAAAMDAHRDGAIVLYGRSDEGLGIPYQPWVEALTHLVRHAPAEVLAAHVEARGHELGRLVPDLVGVAEGIRPTSTAESDRYLLFGAVVDLLARTSSSAPVVLVLDDLQWSDRPTMQLLRHVVSADATLRLLVIGTFRDTDVDPAHPLAEALAAFHREPGVERIDLCGLGDDELLALIEAIAPPAAPTEGVALRDALSAETDGNPFFVRELLRHLAESSASGDDGTDGPVVDVRTSGLPVSIREVIGQRVARLGPQAQDVLVLAAVIGRDVDTEVLLGVSGLADDAFVDACDEATAVALLTEGDEAGRYSFAHALIERTLYDGLSSARRGRIHRRVGEALEALDDVRRAERVGELAHHWARAVPADTGRAIAHARQAGDRALAGLAPDEALRWYHEALDLQERTEPDDLLGRAELLLGVGDAQRQTGDPAHRDTLLDVGGLAHGLGATDLLVRSVLRNSRGWVSVAGGIDRERIAMIELALAGLSDVDGPDRARLLALHCVELTWDVAFDERLALADEAIDMARRIGDDAVLVDAIRLCQEAITMPETLRLRREWTTEACALVEEFGDPTARLHANDYRYLAALEAGDRDGTRAPLAIVRTEAKRIGQPIYRWVIEYHDALEWLLDGDLDAAEQAVTLALGLGDEAGYAVDAMTIYGPQLMTLRWMQGRFHEMLPLVEQAAAASPELEIFRAALAVAVAFAEPERLPGLLDSEIVGGFQMFADSTWLAGQALWVEAVVRGRHRPAAELLYERLVPWHDQFATTHITPQGSVAHYLGWLSGTLGRPDEANDWFAEALAVHERMEAPYFIAWTQASWAALLVDRDQPGDGAQARVLADEAHSVASSGGYGYVDAEARSVLERLG